MTFKTPKFWSDKNSKRAAFLSPLSYIYQCANALSQSRRVPYQSDIPVICVGNLTAGGGGKTPTVQALIQLTKTHNIAQNPCILSRGYGGIRDAHIVNAAVDTFKDVGDEPLLLSKFAPVIIAKNRGDGAKIAEQNGFDCIIMDDGYQNNQLKKDISILVVDGSYGFGNQRLLPAGPLREPIETGIRRSDGVLIIGKDTYDVCQLIPAGKLVFNAALNSASTAQKNQNYIAFCGLALPQKFKNTLQHLEINIKEFISFADHHPYAHSDIEKLLSKAKAQNTRLITTEKDLMRLQDFDTIQPVLDIVSIELEIDNSETLISLLKEAIS